MRACLMSKNPSIMSGGFVMGKHKSAEPEPEDSDILEVISSRSSQRHYEYND